MADIFQSKYTSQEIEDKLDNSGTKYISGVFPDYNNLLTTITTQGTSWTATEDCVTTGYIIGNAGEVYVDNVTVIVSMNGAYNSNNIYIKKGQTITTRDTYGTYNLNIYGLQQSDKNKISYSLEEQTIGTWIDGKQLYQKTWQFSLNFNNNSWNSKDLNMLSEEFDYISIYEEDYKFDENYQQANAYRNSSRYCYSSIDKTSTNLTYQVFSVYDSAPYNKVEITLTLRYTKTID